MRRDIAKLLETGQEATARIRVFNFTLFLFIYILLLFFFLLRFNFAFHFQVEHIVREENMMAAQEIIELFSELIAVRLPIIETQRFVCWINSPSGLCFV
jgi:hypothetical protein